MAEMENSKKEELLSYVKAQRQNGVSEESIKSALMREGGWSAEEVDALLNEAKDGVVEKTDTTPKEKPEEDKPSFTPPNEKFTQQVDPKSSKSKGPNKGVFVAIILIFIILILGAGAYFTMQKSTSNPPNTEPENNEQPQENQIPPEEVIEPLTDEEVKLNLKLFDAIALGDVSKIEEALALGSDLNYETQSNWFFVEDERRRAGKELFGSEYNRGFWPLPDEYSDLSKEEFDIIKDKVSSKISTSSMIIMSQGGSLPEGDLSPEDYEEYYELFGAPQEEDSEKEWTYLNYGTTPIDFAKELGNEDVISFLESQEL